MSGLIHLVNSQAITVIALMAALVLLLVWLGKE